MIYLYSYIVNSKPKLLKSQFLSRYWKHQGKNPLFRVHKIHFHFEIFYLAAHNYRAKIYTSFNLNFYRKSWINKLYLRVHFLFFCGNKLISILFFKQKSRESSIKYRVFLHALQFSIQHRCFLAIICAFYFIFESWDPEKLTIL